MLTMALSGMGILVAPLVVFTIGAALILTLGGLVAVLVFLLDRLE